MKNLSQYIIERVSKLEPNKTGIIVFDIDDTLLKADSSKICIYKKEPNKSIIRLTTADFANDEDKNLHPEWFDLSDFEDEDKVYDSIISGAPIIRNLKIMDAYLNAGYDFAFLTARGCEDVIQHALDDILLRRTKDNRLVKLGKMFNHTMSYAVNDKDKKYPGKDDAEKKSNVLKKICKLYNKVVFVDDDDNNIKSAKSLGLNNLIVIKAYQ